MLFAEIMILPLSCLAMAILALQARKVRKLEDKVGQQEQTIIDIRAEMHALLNCERGMGLRIKQQQQQVKNVIERQDKLEVNDISHTSYKQAMVLLQKGISTDELVDACDLSRGELALLSRLNPALKAAVADRAA